MKESRTPALYSIVTEERNILHLHLRSCCRNSKQFNLSPVPENHMTTQSWNHSLLISKKKNFIGVDITPRKSF